MMKAEAGVGGSVRDWLRCALKSKTTWINVALWGVTLLVGSVVASVTRGPIGRAAVYHDWENRTWRVPMNGFVTKTVNKVINSVPRIKGVRMIDPGFDLDNSDYISSTVFYVMTCGAIGMLFALLVGIYFLLRYKFDKCGGKTLPRNVRYRQEAITGVRIVIMVFSFGLSGVLIFGFFANTDLHTSLKVGVKHFVNWGYETVERGLNLRTAVALLKDVQLEPWNSKQESFLSDLDFAINFYRQQVNQMKGAMATFEDLRMALVVLACMTATVSCAIGIAAGNVSKGFFVIIMMIGNSVAGLLIFFSLGLHFAGSKTVFEFCEETEGFLKDDNADMMPMRLQFFTPCVSSPGWFYIADHYQWHLTKDLEEWWKGLPGLPPRLSQATPYWFNISLPIYGGEMIDAAGLAEDAKQRSRDARQKLIDDYVVPTETIDDMIYCKRAKQSLKNQRFLMCSYLRDNLDMLTMSQLFAAIFIIIITINGAPGISMFEWAGRLNQQGVLGAGQALAKKEAKAKRAVAS